MTGAPLQSAAAPVPDLPVEFCDFRWCAIEEYCRHCRTFAVYRGSTVQQVTPELREYRHAFACRCREYAWARRELADGTPA